jgi:hypothetical protein
MKFEYLKSLGAIAFCFGLASVCAAQNPPTPPPADQAAPAAAPAAPAAPMPLPTPAITGPLSGAPPFIFDAGPFGNIAVNGILSGIALGQDNHVPGDNSSQFAISNGQVWIQKTDGVFQFYLQAGAYNYASLGVPFLSTQKTITDSFGPIPVGFLKLQAGKNTSFEIGALPTLIGAESTFTFQNMNVLRGLLWNQENLVNRGMQVNQTLGKFSLSFSYNDGFYSNRYTWLSGLISYTNGPHALSFVAGGNYKQTKFETFATPVQNNSSIYNVIYTYTKGPLIIQPYYQYTNVPMNLSIGVPKGTSTNGGAILASYTIGGGFALTGRYEYISTSGNALLGSLNLLFGPGSTGNSFTLTPTWQKGGFFARGDIAFVHAGNYTLGDGFGSAGLKDNQFRTMVEAGFIFGDNIMKKP